MQELKFDSVSYLAGGKRVFLMNLFTAPMAARVRYRDPVGGAWVDTGEHRIPALSVWAWTDGKLVYQTGETPT